MNLCSPLIEVEAGGNLSYPREGGEKKKSRLKSRNERKEGKWRDRKRDRNRVGSSSTLHVPLLLWERRSSLDTCRGVTRDVGKGEDARMRFNKCHRPQVGDVLAPQTRLQGVRFPLDLDNSALPTPLPLCPLNERIRGTCIRFRVRHTSVASRETDTSCPLCDSFGHRHDARESNGFAVEYGGATRPRKFCIRRDLNAWTCARYGMRRVKLFESTTHDYPLSALSLPRSRAVAQCYSTGERKLQYEKGINSWPFLCKEADRATTRHSFGREPI